MLNYTFNQYGGNKPIVNSIRGLSDISNKYDKYFNPINGYVIEELGAIRNYILFGEPSNYVVKLVKELYNILNFNEIVPSNKPSLPLLNISIEEMGVIIACMYISYKEIDVIPRLKTFRDQNVFKSYVEEFIDEKNKKVLGKLFQIFNKYLNNIEKDTLISKDDKEIITIELFSVILSLVWWKSENRKGIYNYYNGINKVLSKKGLELIDLTEDFKIIPTKGSDFEESLIKIHNSKKSIIPLQTQKRVTYKGVEFSDCGSSSLRNFLQLISYDPITNSYDLDIFEKMKGDRIPTDKFVKLLSFFRRFNTPELQNNDDEKYEEGKGIRDLWAEITSEIPNVNYLKEVDGVPIAEINSGRSKTGILNMLEVIKYLFPEIVSWDKFVSLGILKSIRDDVFSKGELRFETGIGNYIWNFEKSHYYIDKELTSSMIIDLSMLDDRENLLCRLYKGNLKSSNLKMIKLEYGRLKNWFYYLNYSEDDFETLFNNFNLISDNTKLYSNLFLVLKYIDSDDLMSRIYVNYEYLVNEKEYIKKHRLLKKLKVEDKEINAILNSNNLKSFKLFKFKINLEIFPLLEELSLFELEEPLGDMLHSSSNLKILKIDNNYKYPIGDSFKKLVNLEKLFLDSNLPLEDSLDNLTNLKELHLENVNISLGDSLNKLKNLQVLYLQYNNTVNEFRNSLDKLENLRKLILVNYSLPFKDSLVKLGNLEELHIKKSSNNDIKDSLRNLKNLKSLSIESFNKKIGDSFDNLTNLEKLKLNSFNTEIGNSLDKLVNLKELALFKFDKDIGDSLKYSVNLRVLILGFTYSKSFDKEFDNCLELRKVLKKSKNGDYMEYPKEKLPLYIVKRMEDNLEKDISKEEEMVKELLSVNPSRSIPNSYYYIKYLKYKMKYVNLKNGYYKKK